MGYDVVNIGVGAGNVIRHCSLFKRGERCINVGYAGSNILPVGTVAKVSKTFRLSEGNAEFADFRNGYELSKDGYPCYTANDFVTYTEEETPVLFDMELNYIAAFDLDLIGSVKIVSDNLQIEEYEFATSVDDDETWGKVKEICDEISKSVL